jgi:hypothetical protein
MLLGATDGQLRLIERFAALVEHTVPGLVGQRVFGIALGYEDLIDHDQLRHDPVMAVLGGKLAAKRADYAATKREKEGFTDQTAGVLRTPTAQSADSLGCVRKVRCRLREKSRSIDRVDT